MICLAVDLCSSYLFVSLSRSIFFMFGSLFSLFQEWLTTPAWSSHNHSNIGEEKLLLNIHCHKLGIFKKSYQRRIPLPPPPHTRTSSKEQHSTGTTDSRINSLQQCIRNGLLKYSFFTCLNKIYTSEECERNKNI